MIRFSILITTRFRTDFLKNLLESIDNTTVNKDAVEIRVIYDNDDKLTQMFINNVKLNLSVKTYFHCIKRSMDLVKDYHILYSIDFII